MQGKQKLFREPMLRMIVAGGIVLLLTAAVLLRTDRFLTVLSRILHAFRPLLLGVLFAAMLEPSYKRLRADFTAFAVRRKRDPNAGWIRLLSLIGAILPPVLIVVSVICVLVPQIVRSVRLLSDNLSVYSDNLLGWLGQYSETALARLVPQARLESLLTDLQNKIPLLLRKTYDYTASFVGVIADICIGAVFSLYLLADKSRLFRQVMTIGGYFMPKEKLRRMTQRGQLICETFARFIGSQCKESLILGGLCWLGMQLFHFPYPVLISAMIGITNIVPYIGPLAGTIPCMLLLLLVQPRAVLWFLVYIVMLQQLESNLIYPRVVGHSIGLPPAWVLAAIVLGGGLFGMTGLLLGVPFAAVIYAALFPEDAA